MIKVRAHTCYLGNTGYAAHARSFFRALSNYVDLRVRNYTWDSNPTYLDNRDFAIIDKITLTTGKDTEEDFPITHSFPDLPWKTHESDFVPDVDIVLMDNRHSYFYEEYDSRVKIAFNVWESTELEKDFFDQLLKFDYLWVVTDWHREMVVKQGYPAHRVFIVNEGVDEIFCNDTFPVQSPKDTFDFLFFGRWDYRKSVPEIVRAFLNAFSEENVRLILSADNPFAVDGFSSTEERLRHHGFEDPRIVVKHFLSREDYVSYIKSGNVLVTCARSEGWNIPLIEAMSAGTPVTYSEWGAQLEFARGKGVPVKIKTELPAVLGASMSYSKDVPGNYAEPDYVDLEKKLRECFDNYEIVKKKAIEDAVDIRQKFNWGRIGEIGYNILMKVVPYDLPQPFKKEIAIVVSHADNREKKLLLERSLIALKRKGYFCVVSSHRVENVENIADYMLYDRDNPIVYPEEYSKLSSMIPVHYIEDDDINLNYPLDFNHSYAAFKLILNGLAFSHGMGYEIAHIVGYDYIIEENLLDEHVRDLQDCDLVSYSWEFISDTPEDKTSINSSLFSVNISKALLILVQTRSKEDFFKYNGIIVLESFLYTAFHKNGACIKIKNIEDVKNNNHINCVIIQTYPVITSNNKFKGHIYLTSDNYIGVISHDSSLQFNVQYDEKIGKYLVTKHSKVFVKILPEMLEKGFVVRFPVQDQIFRYDSKSRKATCKIKNNRIIKELLLRNHKTYDYSYNFIDGAFVEIRGDTNDKFLVKFIDEVTDNVHYSTELTANSWAKCSIKYFVKWKIEILNMRTKELHVEKFDLRGKNVLVSIDSSSLGDSIAWFAHVEEFGTHHKCKLIVSTFNNDLFKEKYPGMVFVNPGEVVHNLYASYTIGWFYKDNLPDSSYHSRDFRKISMQQTTTDILGLNYKPLRPKLKVPDDEIPVEGPYVCFGIHSTAQAKYWNNVNGWQQLTDYFVSNGMKVVVLSKEGDDYMGNHYPYGVENYEPGNIQKAMTYLKGCELFVGVGSGLTWLSWAMGVPTVLISGFSYPFTEFVGDNVHRIFNKNACTGCFNRHKLDAGDWNWCPDHKGTTRQFECTKLIRAEDVIHGVEELRRRTPVEDIVEEGYKLGMMQSYHEIYEVAIFLGKMQMKSFIEIGTDMGGTFVVLSRLAGYHGKKISVDIPHGEYGKSESFFDTEVRNFYLKSMGDDVHLIEGNSHDIVTKNVVSDVLGDSRVDFLFIDGDHTYEGVKKDYEMYREFVKDGGWIGFHDIKDTDYHREYNCGVHRLWEELKKNNEHVEFIDRHHCEKQFGIGLLKVKRDK